MAVPLLESFVLPALSGMSIALIGVAYRLGQARGVRPLEVLGACCLLGTAMFATSFAREGGRVADMPVSLWAWGLAAGLGQYAAVRLFGTALRYGPLAPAWCVVSLNFVPTMVYGAFFLSERLSILQYLGMAASVACVVVASMKPEPKSQTGPSSALPAMGRSGRLVYLAILATIFVVGSLLSIALRDVSEHKALLGTDLFARHKDFVLLLCYVTLMVCALLDAGLAGRLRTSPRTLAALGLLAGIGSVGGLSILSLCAGSAVAFAIAGIAQILAVALISVLAFREQPTANWYGTIALGVAAVALASAA